MSVRRGGNAPRFDRNHQAYFDDEGYPPRTPGKFAGGLGGGVVLPLWEVRARTPRAVHFEAVCVRSRMRDRTRSVRRHPFVDQHDPV